MFLCLELEAKTLTFAPTNIEKMLKTFLITVIILVICVALMAVKVIFKKGGRFPNTHVSGNSALRKKGIHCAKAQHKEQNKQKTLYDRLQEIEE